MLPGPRWRKAARDLWLGRSRTALVVLSIAIGVFGVGVIATSWIVLSRDFDASYAAAKPASAVIYTAAPFDDELVQGVRRMPGIADAEGRRSLAARAQTGPDEWRQIQLIAIPSYADIRVDTLTPEAGDWPPGEREVEIERSWLAYLRTEVGGTLVVETPRGVRRELRVVGTVHDVGQPPAFFGGTGYGYITFNTLEWLGETDGYDQLRILVSDPELDRSGIQQIAATVRSRVEGSGRTVLWTAVPQPGEHPVSAALQALVMLLGALGLLSSLLSGFLVFNTISALLAQQVRQIGVMKTIGASTGQVMGIYVGVVLVIGALALGLGVPLGALGASALTSYVASLVNVDLASFTLPTEVLVLQVMIGLSVPLLAALYPVARGTGITIREAISDYGLGKEGAFGEGLIDRLLGRVQGLPRPLLLSLRNTFRRKGRLALTLVTLALAGVIFIAVYSVRESMLQTLDDGLRYFRYDISVSFNRSYAVGQITQIAAGTPGVTGVETLGMRGVRRVRADDSESDNFVLAALPPQTSLIQPTLLQGRWLTPDDENAIVIGTPLLRREPDIQVGEDIVLKIDGRKSTWRVVGIVRYVFDESIAYTGYPYFVRVVRDVGHASGVWITTEGHDADTQARVARELEQRFRDAGLDTSSIDTISESREIAEGQFGLLVGFLLFMTLLIAAVGSLGLAGTMSLNVIERTREIGVMRAIGASNGDVRQILIVEGVVIGVLSWLVGSVAALPLSKLLSDQVGILFMAAPLSFRFSQVGMVVWLAAVVALAALASALPARSAARLTVREVLSYE